MTAVKKPKKTKKKVSIDLLNEKFNSSLFLAIVHSKSNLKQLTESQTNLKERIKDQQDEIKHLVSENLGKLLY
jgi:hypothetical protein